MNSHEGTKWIWSLFLAAWFSSAGAAWGVGHLQLVSARDSTIAAPAGGTGNSDLPIISADGRYVVFASVADNLVSNPYAGPVSALRPRSLQVFVRDRVTGTTSLISANLAGAPGSGDSFPAAISTNGQFVLFESAASDLVNGDNNGLTDVFLRDLVNQNTTLVSVNTNGLAGNGISHNAVMTPDARFIAFSSAASDLVASDTNGIPDVFVRDSLAGSTKLASVRACSVGWSILPSTSESPDITPDGRFVSFYTSATNLIPGSTVPGQVFVRDLSLNTTTWASSNASSLFQSAFGSTNEVACNQRISADGNYVAFEACTNPPNYNSNTSACALILRFNLQTGTTDLVSTNATAPAIQFEDINTLDITPDGRYITFIAATNFDSTTSATCINLWDAQSAATTLISQNLNGGVSASDAGIWPRLDSTGRYVVFFAAATNLTTNSVSGYNCYLRDVQAGTTILVNADTNGTGSGVNILTPPEICNDGHLVAFVCGDGNLVPNDDNAATDVFVRDVLTNATELVSQHDPAQADVSTGFSSGFSTVSVSSNGLFVAFTSEGSLVGTDTNNLRDVYLRNVVNETNILVSVNTNGVAATGFSSEPSTDATGRYVLFSSSATDLISGDSNNSFDVFIRDLSAGTTTLVSKNATGSGEGNADSSSPLVSADARYVLFFSLANNLTAGTFSGNNLYLRDQTLGTNYALTFSGAGSASMTPDGRRIAFTVTSFPNSKLYVWDKPTAKLIYTNTGSYKSITSISPDGNWVVWFDPQVKMASLVSNSLTVVSSGSASSRFGARFSGDGRFLVYSVNVTNALDTNAVADIYLYDVQSGTNTLISRRYNSALAPNGASESPVISSDGRFIAYRSFASNNVITDLNEAPDLLLYDRSNALTMLITASSAGNRTANDQSQPPVFSADGKTLVFSGWASDLLPHDFNLGSDVFLLTLAGSSGTGGTNGSDGGDLVSGLQMFQSPNAYTVPAFSWTAQPGFFYHVQFKDDLSDPVWHDFSGSTTVMGNVGQAYDLTPAVSQRFYRVISGN